MLKDNVQIGATYLIRHHDGELCAVRIIRSKTHQYYQAQYGPLTVKTTRYEAVKIKTGRVIEIKSAAKLRRPLTEEEIAKYS